MTINELAKKLHNEGMTILGDKQEKRKYFAFSDGNSIGYVQYEKYRGFGFSTVNKPSKNYGTGTSTFREEHDDLVEKAKSTLKEKYTLYSYAKEGPEYYSTVEEFINKKAQFRKNYGIIEKDEIDTFVGLPGPVSNIVVCAPSHGI